MKSINLYYSKSLNNVIGRENEIIWYHHSVLSDFREKTKGQIVLMGKRSWEVIPGNLNPYSQCFVIVVTRDTSFYVSDENVSVVNDLDSYLDNYYIDETEDRELWVVGGGDILNQCIKKADTIEIIEIDNIEDGNIMAPKVDGRSFKHVSTDSKKLDTCFGNSYSHLFYRRISKSLVVN